MKINGLKTNRAEFLEIDHLPLQVIGISCGTAMKARQLIEQSSLDQGTQKAIGHAFDEAWDDVASNFSDPVAIEAARCKLANAILAVASETSRDVGVLKRAGLKAMTQGYDF